jgi:hypothetical protein
VYLFTEFLVALSGEVRRCVHKRPPLGHILSLSSSAFVCKTRFNNILFASLFLNLNVTEFSKHLWFPSSFMLIKSAIRDFTYYLDSIKSL